MIPLKHYTLEEALNDVRQGMDQRTDDPTREPLYMLIDIRRNLDVRYSGSALNHLPSDTVGWLRVPTRPEAERRTMVYGHGVTRAGVELMVARANRRPAYMRYGIPLAVFGFPTSAKDLQLRYTAPITTGKRGWVVRIQWEDGTWTEHGVRGRRRISEEATVGCIVDAMLQARVSSRVDLVLRAAEQRKVLE